MKQFNELETIDVAMLPLSDGRHAVLPLIALAEVQQISVSADDSNGLGTLRWRGHDLPIGSLEEYCGLPLPALERHITVGVFRADEQSAEPFRALAFCGLASHRCLAAEDIKPLDMPAEGKFVAVAEIEDEVCVVPDLKILMYTVNRKKVH